MATFNFDYYGLTKYGTLVKPVFSVEPFTATVASYDLIHLRWARVAGGDWQTLRVLKSLYGYAVHETDGDLVFETDGATSETYDTDISPGRWHYYTVWIQANDIWYKAGIASALGVIDHGYSQRLHDLVPTYFKFDFAWGGGALLDEAPEVEALQRWLRIFGWGFDQVKTSYDDLLNVNDATTTHVANLLNLSKQLGIDFEYTAPLYLARTRVRDSGLIARQRGTLDGLRNVVGATVGWDLDMHVGPNLMLNEDQASFVHPDYPGWHALTTYHVGDRVIHLSFLYECREAAYGEAQRPTGLETNNTWWRVLRETEDRTLTNPETGGISTWQAVSATDGVNVDPAALAIGIGVQSRTDPDVVNANALLLRNTSGSLARLGMRSISTELGESGLNPERVVRDGVPVPIVTTTWDPDTSYEPGDLVLWRARSWQALTTVLGVPPSEDGSTSDYWEAVGPDERVRLAVSIHAATGTKPSRQGSVFVEWFDEHGNFICRTDSETSWRAHYDGFNDAGNDFGALPYGGCTWTVNGSWKKSPSEDNGFAFPADSTGSLVIQLDDDPTSDPETPDSVNALKGTTIAHVTFLSEPEAGRHQGIVFQSDALLSTGWIAARDGVYAFEGGAWVSKYTYDSNFVNGDRMTLEYRRLSPRQLTVSRNGTPVLSIDDPPEIPTTEFAHVGLAVV